jgi:hypothetical protein
MNNIDGQLKRTFIVPSSYLGILSLVKFKATSFTLSALYFAKKQQLYAVNKLNPTIFDKRTKIFK